MEYIERVLKELDEISERYSKRLDEVFTVPIKMVKDLEGVYVKANEVKSNIDVKSNIALVKWWHFNWLMSAQFKLFGRYIVY